MVFSQNSENKKFRKSESPEVPKGTFRDCKQSPRSRASPDFGSSPLQKRDYEEKSVNKIFYDNDRRKTGMKSAFRLCFIYNSYKIACQERAGNPPVFLTFFIIPVSVPHT